jgi:DNA-binding transcriptional LysR family regulator
MTEAATAFGINQATLTEQMQRLEHDIGTTLFHRATPASQPQHPTERGAALLQALAGRGIQPPASSATANIIASDLPADLLIAVQGQRRGWTRLERFAATMAHPTITDAATAIGVNRTTLIDQLHRLETDLGEALYHRATSDGQPQHPTNRGTTLLAAFDRSDVQALHAQRARLPRIPAQPPDGRNQ